MSFRSLYRRAIDPTLPLPRRYLALRNAGDRYAGLTGTSFTSVFAELECRHQLSRGAPNSAGVIAAAAEELSSARDHFLQRLRGVADRRRAGKHAPRRPREPSPEVELRDAILLGEPLVPRSGLSSTRFPDPPSTPPPVHEIGCLVRVTLNERNRTPHTGFIRERIWHYELNCWTYCLTVDGRRVSKRYLESDLRPLDAG